MIGSLRGTLGAVTGEGEIVVEVGGVGYRVAVTPGTVVAVGPGGSPVLLHIHTHVREDAIVLYGFIHDDERRCFEALLGAHGVGPSLALAVLSVLSPAALSTAVLEDDVETLCAVPGVGRKTAARLLIDLKSRLELPDLSLRNAPGGAGVRSSRTEARAALTELGYSPEEIRGALDGIDAGVGVEDMLRLALRELAAR
ncbi:MAG: Holliday junction branch migration protein RuvA [Acidimicrobiales bacterium]